MAGSLGRREVLLLGAAFAAATPLGGGAGAEPVVAQQPLDLAARLRRAAPISSEERLGRLAALQGRMAEKNVSALLLETGSSLEYFTGVRWPRSERTTAAVLPVSGVPIVVTPAFEEPSVRETLGVPAEVRPWNEDESPFARLAQALQDRGAARGVVGVEGTTRSFIVEAVAALAPAARLLPGQDLVDAGRMIKSPHELELLEVANLITLEALRQVRAQTRLGMTSADLAALMDRTTVELGGRPEFSLVLLNEASAYPHGSKAPQAIREGSVVLMDCGCAVHGYQSDISRTFVYGRPDPRVVAVWNTVKRGQEIALETAALGRPAGRIDDAVRAFYEKEGWGPGYRLPGLSHRTGHGIGLDGHEAPYLVHGDERPLRAGMCFSDEPGIYIPGAFGVRLEDCWRMTADGPALFTPLARSLQDPI